MKGEGGLERCLGKPLGNFVASVSPACWKSLQIGHSALIRSLQTAGPEKKKMSRMVVQWDLLRKAWAEVRGLMHWAPKLHTADVHAALLLHPCPFQDSAQIPAANTCIFLPEGFSCAKATLAAYMVGPECHKINTPHPPTGEWKNAQSPPISALSPMKRGVLPEWWRMEKKLREPKTISWGPSRGPQPMPAEVGYKYPCSVTAQGVPFWGSCLCSIPGIPSRMSCPWHQG